MAALIRPKSATYEVHENVTVDTLDNEDHTFCGIMFPIKCKDLLPIDHLVITSVAVRGHLGPLTVWVSNADANVGKGHRSSRRPGNVLRRRGGREDFVANDDYRIPLHPSSWTKLYDRTHKPCPRGHYTELVFDEPVRLKPGEMRAFYIHSTLPGDQAIVYDNSYYGDSGRRYNDDKLSILTGRAHVSTTCFGQDPIWGWGNAWRDRREFVGRLAYGTVYKLWNPEVSPKFGTRFQDGTRALLLCQRRWESPVSALPDEAIYYILNMCPWDWFEDSTNTMKDRRKLERARKRLILAQQQYDQEQKKAVASTTASKSDDGGAKPCTMGGVCTRTIHNQAAGTTGVAHGGKSTGLEDSEEDADESYDMKDSDEEDNDVDDHSMDDDREMNTDEDVDDDEEDESFSNDSSDDDDHYHNANRRVFGFHYVDSDDEENDGQEHRDPHSPRTHWLRRQIARVHVLRALASMEDQAFEHSL